jgi:histidinol phosphatase-like PHP family hydrolase
MQEFVHLHVHTQYSLLDGQTNIKKMVDKAVADGMPGVAVTDHGNMMGFIKFGSRVDIYLPVDSLICVKMNQKVTGNITILAKLA